MNSLSDSRDINVAFWPVTTFPISLNGFLEGSCSLLRWAAGKADFEVEATSLTTPFSFEFDSESKNSSCKNTVVLHKSYGSDSPLKMYLVLLVSGHYAQ